MADDTKGKGKSKAPSSASNQASEASSDNGSSGNSAAQTLASALRTTMASSQLGSLMQSVGGSKEGFQHSGQGGGGGGELRDWLTQDLRSAAGSAASSSAARSRTGGFRSQGGVRGAEDAGKMFDDFERGTVLNSDSAAGVSSAREGISQHQQGARMGWNQTGLDPSNATAVHSYTDLDGPLHASVRSDHARAPRLPVLPAPLTQSAPPAHATQSDDIFALLDAEQQSQQADSTTSEPSLESALSRFPTHYRPPSPSHPSFTSEQAALHLSLAESQSSTQGQQELLIPRPDNPSLREGVYAPTAEAALSSIFAAAGRGESTEVSEDRGAEVVRKITRYFGATSYVDDVYGVSPVLREVVEEVESGEGERRERAVRRLEALWMHLSNAKPQGGTGWVDDWLVKNT